MNNCNLYIFEVDIVVSERLVSDFLLDVCFISELGFWIVEDVVCVS